MKKLLLAIAIALPITAFAGEGSGKITRIFAHEKGVDGLIIFNVVNHTNPPEECPNHEWAFDANTDHGKAMYALLLASASQGQPVTVQGAGDCRDWADRERPIWIMADY